MQRSAAQGLRNQEGFLRALLRTIPGAVWLKDADGVYLACNEEFERLCGAPEDHIVGKTDFDFVATELAEFFRGKDNEARAAGETRWNEEWVVYPDGHRALWDTAKTPMIDADGRFVGVLGVARDITERRRAEDGVSRSERQFRELFQRHGAVMLLVEPDSGRLVDVNAAAERFYGYSADQLRTLTFGDLRQVAHAAVQREDTEPGGHHAVEPHRLANGEVRTVETWTSPVDTPRGTLHFVIVHDVTERVAGELRLRLAATVFTNAREGIIICDSQQRILDANPSFSAITGYAREEVLGATPRMLASGRHGVDFYQDMWRLVDEDGYWEGEVWNRRKSGALYAERMSIAAVRDERDVVTHYIGSFSDITTLKSHQAQLERLAHHDALTGLPNRTLLAERLDWALAQYRRRSGPRLAVCYLDLDQFKPINDTHGHDIGDLLLIDVGGRLSRAVRAADTVARLGGDEFVLLLAELRSVDQCVRLVQRILDAVTKPLVVDNLTLSVTASIGIAIYPDDGVDADTLLRHADQAMYQAKQAGRNRLHLFDRNEEEAARARRSQRERLSQGLTGGELRLHYQPSVDMRRGAVVGVEALIHWDHPERGLLPPTEFLPWVTGTELDPAVGRWVLAEGLDQLATWRAEGLDLHLSVNISATHLLHAGFVDELAALLARHAGIPDGALEIDILESAALGDLDRATAVILGCHELGVRVALDDFGTGYSSLSYLRSLPIDTVKLDQSFVRTMTVNPEDLAIVQSVIGLSRAFGRGLVAAGVETAALGAMLLELGCEVAQGYGIARPMPADALPAWVRGFSLPAGWTA